MERTYWGKNGINEAQLRRLRSERSDLVRACQELREIASIVGEQTGLEAANTDAQIALLEAAINDLDRAIEVLEGPALSTEPN